MTFILSKVLSGPPSPRWRSDSRNLCQAFVTRTRPVTTVGAVPSYSLRVNLCDTDPCAPCSRRTALARESPIRRISSCSPRPMRLKGGQR
jgi:hypothetical protein